MNVGVSVPLPAYLVDVGAMARNAEALGFESFWCAEHPFIPVQSASRFPGSEDGVIPESYSHFVDPFVALARASGTTTRIKLGTGIVLVPERHPLLLAKEVSTLDLFSGGRFLFGIGAGWLREETEIMGGDFDHRWTQTRSVLRWDEQAEFHGRYYNATAAGFASRRTSSARAGPLDRLAKDAGRDPNAITISVHGQPADRDLIRRLLDAGHASSCGRPRRPTPSRRRWA